MKKLISLIIALATLAMLTLPAMAASTATVQPANIDKDDLVVIGDVYDDFGDVVETLTVGALKGFQVIVVPLTSAAMKAMHCPTVVCIIGSEMLGAVVVDTTDKIIYFLVEEKDLDNAVAELTRNCAERVTAATASVIRSLKDIDFTKLATSTFSDLKSDASGTAATVSLKTVEITHSAKCFVTRNGKKIWNWSTRQAHAAADTASTLLHTAKSVVVQ